MNPRDLNQLHLFGPEMLNSPYAIYDQLRETDPVHWSEQLNGWVLTRADDITSVLKSPHFSSDRVTPVRDRLEQRGFKTIADTLSLVMVQRDDPDHKRIRTLVHSAFMRRAVGNYEPLILNLIDELLDDALAAGEVDFLHAFAIPLPVMVISEIVGIPKADRQQIKTWCDDYAMVALNFYASISDEQLQQGQESILAFKAYLRDQVHAIEREPRQDLLTALVEAEHDGDKLSLDELLANCLLLLTAGNETTTALIVNGLKSLLDRPDQLARLRNDPQLIPTAIEEFLRFNAPVQFLARVPLEDLEVGGKQIRAGQLVFVVIGAGGYDTARFVRPNELDISRDPNHHLAFGHGQHLCTGIQLARLEASLAFKRILERCKSLELLKDDIEYRANFNMRCLSELPLRLA